MTVFDDHACDRLRASAPDKDATIDGVRPSRRAKSEASAAFAIRVSGIVERLNGRPIISRISGASSRHAIPLIVGDAHPAASDRLVPTLRGDLEVFPTPSRGVTLVIIA